MAKPYFITTPIYYINSTPSVGHAYTQIAADARARFERLRGREVYFLTGTDENAIKVARVAQEQGKDPLAFCDELAQAFKDVWDKLNISYDDFIRTTEERHRVPVRKVVQRLWDDKFLRLDTYSGWYSVPDETFFRNEDVTERDGGHYITNPTEDQSKAPLEWVEEVGHFFVLSEFSDKLLDYYAAHEEVLRPDSRKNETLSFIKMGLRDTSISRVQDWGIPLPDSVPEAADHVVYVWFPDALLNYATAPGYLSADPAIAARFEQIWPPDLQLMSKDIFTRFHATLWPALLMSLGLELPRELFAHGFWTVNGRKISKRDPETVIEPIAFCEGIVAASGCDFEVAVDALRYYCLREVPFGVDGDFSTQGCFVRYNADLANGLGNLLNRAVTMVHLYFEGRVPAAPDTDLGLRRDLPGLLEAVANDYATLDFSGALAKVAEVIGRANKLIEEQKPWAKAKAGQLDEIPALLHELLGVCQWAAITMMPVMPSSAERIWAALGRDNAPTWEGALESTFEAGHALPPAKIVFPRATLPKKSEEKSPKPEQQASKKKTMDTPTNPTPTPVTTEANPAAPDQAPHTIEGPIVENPFITIDDFGKIQLRVAKVLEAERVPKADKLLRLQVDLGDEKRQILAGIAQHYLPEDLVGKNVIIVANLAPRTLRGYESQGMVLAASDDESVIFVTPEKDIAPGATVR